MPTSVRLDARTERLIARLSRGSRRTKSEVIRDVISKLADAEAAAPLTGRTPYEGLEHLIGLARGGPADLSVRTGDKLRRLLDGRRRAS
jgi:hypothetical protein